MASIDSVTFSDVPKIVVADAEFKFAVDFKSSNTVVQTTLIAAFGTAGINIVPNSIASGGGAKYILRAKALSIGNVNIELDLSKIEFDDANDVGTGVVKSESIKCIGNPDHVMNFGEASSLRIDELFSNPVENTKLAFTVGSGSTGINSADEVTVTPIIVTDASENITRIEIPIVQETEYSKKIGTNMFVDRIVNVVVKNTIATLDDYLIIRFLSGKPIRIA